MTLCISITSFAASSFGNGTVPFSPTVTVQNVVNDENNPQSVSTIVADSTWIAPSPSVVPSHAMYHSLILPGWGQIDNGKKLKAALFITAEIICIGGYLVERHRIKHEGLTDWERDVHRTDRNTFIIYFLVSKMLGIVDAYVDAHLATFNVEDITPEALKNTQSE